MANSPIQFYVYPIADAIEELSKNASRPDCYVDMRNHSTSEGLRSILHVISPDCLNISMEDRIFYLRGIENQPVVDTREFLEYFIAHAIVDGKFEPKSITYLNGLLKKFEVFGRLFRSYDSWQRKSSEIFDDIIIYGLFSVALLSVHERNMLPEYLNTALKVNDFILSIYPHVTDELESFLLLSSLSFGCKQVEAFYADHKFRMPTNQ